MNKIPTSTIVIGLIGVLLALGFIFNDEVSQTLGGITNYDAVDVTDGYYVDATQVVDGSGNWLGAILSSSAAVVGRFTQGGGITASSTALSTATLLASEFDVENIIDYTPNGAAPTLTLTASTSFPIATTPGSFREFCIRNATTTAGIGITIAGGTGINLEVASSTLSAGLKVIQPGGVACFDAWRMTSSDIEVFMNPGQ